MPSREEEPAVVTQFIRKVRGASQAILARGSDEKLYVVKFRNDRQGPNLLFNECMGTELYLQAGLPVPSWRLMVLTSQFADRNPACWIETPSGRVRPEPGLCFGSRFLGGQDIRLFEILPGNSFRRVRNRTDFWRAWFIDVCAGHADNRQAIFQQDKQGHMDAEFIDHGHMFCSPNGDLRPSFLASRYYLDPRIYPNVCSGTEVGLRRTATTLDFNALWARVLSLPDEWITRSGLRNFAECLETLSNPRLIERVIEAITGSQTAPYEFPRDELTCGRQPGSSFLRPGIPSGGDRHLTCA